MAKHSGRPVFPVCYVTSLGKRLKTWDEAFINLPFSKAAIVLGEPVWVASNASDDEMEVARQAVEDGLKAITADARSQLGR